MKSSISYCFDNKCIEIPVILLLPSKTLPQNIKQSKKYKQILSSISVVGLVEPLVVYPSKDNDGCFNIVDGHLRAEIFKELHITNAPCLIATFEDTFSYNKRVARLNVIHEHKMILKAVDSGVSIKKLSDALGISEKTIKDRFRMLDGICPEAIQLLTDKDVPRTVFTILKKMKPTRQIEVVNTMISLDNYTYNFVYSMFSYTPDKLLVNKNKSTFNLDKIDNMKKLQSDLIAFDSRKKELQDTYAENSLQLAVIKSHIKKLLSNSKIINWLYDNEPDYLKQLKYLAEK